MSGLMYTVVFIDAVQANGGSDTMGTETDEVAPPKPRRVVVLGTTGSGKSTLATRVAELIGAEYVDLDGLYHGPQWTPRPVGEFIGEVEKFTRRPRWVFDGNYIDRVSATLWPQADTVVWLDLPLWVILPRIVRRTVLRIVRRTELWNGNRERWAALFGRGSLLLWAVTSNRRHRRELPGRLSSLAKSGVRVVRLRSATETDRWLAELARSVA
jgi:adenylate kinase family enzyme